MAPRTKILPGLELNRAAISISDEIRWDAIHALEYRVLEHDDNAPSIGRSGTPRQLTTTPLDFGRVLYPTNMISTRDPQTLTWHYRRLKVNLQKLM